MKRWGIFTLALILLLTLIGGFSWAQGNGPEEGTPAEPMGVEGMVSSSVVYQGRLLENGHPANGYYDFLFKLYDARTGGHLVGQNIRNNVPVQNGLFTTFLYLPPRYVVGNELWLEVRVRPKGGTHPHTVLSPRQPISPVPYALSLRPSAHIEGNVPNGSTILVSNQATSHISSGIHAITLAPRGFAGRFESRAEGGAAIYARAGSDSAPDLILGANNSSYDNGVISSEPRDLDSDIVLRTNDTLRIDLDADKSGNDSDFEIRDKDGHLLFNVDDSGAVISALPRPAYNSGWVALSKGEVKTLTHNLRGNPNNYVVDMTCKSHWADHGINQRFFGGNIQNGKGYGAYWRALGYSSITVVRLAHDIHCEYIRVRIWVYK
ncbi:MAG: hypothetical protein GXO55_07710 [Chloroflexi bacterium]|nr:hypothetical protein [Chloroflexota bacterium]